MNTVDLVKQKLATHKASVLCAMKCLDELPDVSTQEYMAVKGTLVTAAMSADAIKDLLSQELSIDEIKAVSEQVKLIEDTATACREWGLV